MGEKGDIITNSKMSAEIVDVLKSRMYRGQKTTFYKLKCLKCGCDFERDKYTAEKKDVGCPICSNRKIVPGVNDIGTTDPWMVPYFQGGIEEARLYSSGSTHSIYPKCPKCGRIKNTPMNICDLKRYKGFQCVCHDGKTFPNKFIYGLAEELKRTHQIKGFKEEFKLDNKFYDMCFLDECILVEMDSGLNHGSIIQKHKPNKFIPAKTFVNDMQKDDIAKTNNYKIIRVDCYKSEFDYIKKNVLESDLNLLFDLNIINWENILELCSTNIIESVCKYKKENPDASPAQIAPLFGLSDVSVRKYLKIGSTLGWCVYSPEIEWNNYLGRRTYYNAISVYVDPDDDEEEPRFYSSITQMEKNSERDYGIKICRDSLNSKDIKEKGVTSIDGYDIYLVKGDSKYGVQETSSE